ncbi:TetR/AcrR family transcriptional regulator [Solwaraspora sp. WMMD406]|uniref:TetR/AcrR family transcriptional regulator n=1 Tax=Solwaraspora sp. WMMD406 TaxID=3016095 RepID=UPI00241723AF|nr:TetR/AcrR family transcriptional regulator [Solwaraspora sp. WMMD406]MDG4764512.1 TetR/AcrR family transcriptional regulator [Solwaraspora sp. WMMD406]
MLGYVNMGDREAAAADRDVVADQGLAADQDAAASDASGSKAGATRSRYHHGNLRQALLDAAVELIARNGVQGFSLSAAARAAGVSTAAPYRHFATKEALLAAVVEHGWEQFAATLRRAAQRHPDDPLARLAALGRRYIEFAVTRPAVFRLLFGERERDRLRSAAGLTTFATLQDCVRQAREQGQIQPRLDDRAVAHAAWGIVHGLATLYLDDVLAVTEPDASPYEIGDAAIELFVDGLRVRRPAHSAPGTGGD